MDNFTDIHTKLATNGFVIIDILDDTQINYLNQLCEKYLQTRESDFISSSHILSKTDSDFINEELHKIVHQKFKLLFPDLQLLGGTLATKTKGKSNLKAHQDWTIVDESKYNSYNMWIPLVDTNSENGTLALIAGSHKWNQNLRGFNIPNLYEKYTNQFLEIGVEPSIKAGQAILYNHKLIHYSRPNKTKVNRNTAIIGVIDKIADLQISFTVDGKNIETYTMNENEFYQFDVNRIIANQRKLNSSRIEAENNNWKNVYTRFTENLTEDFAHLAKKRKSVFSKIFDKLKF